MQSQRHKEDPTNQMESNPHLDALHEGGVLEWAAAFAPSTIGSPTNNTPSAFTQPISSSEFPLAGRGLLSFTTAAPTYGGDHVQAGGSVEVGLNFIAQDALQYPTGAWDNRGQIPLATPIIDNADFQVGGPFNATSGAALQQTMLYPQWGGMGDMNTSFTVQDNFAPWNGMNGMVYDTPFVPYPEGLNSAFDWNGANASNNMLMLSPTISNTVAPVANAVQQVIVPTSQIAGAPVTQVAASRFQCNHCQKTFRRDADRVRHENSVHFSLPGVLLCSVAGCPKSQGAGYRRQDKLTEHMWKKHAALGYTKRV